MLATSKEKRVGPGVTQRGNRIERDGQCNATRARTVEIQPLRRGSTIALALFCVPDVGPDLKGPTMTTSKELRERRAALATEQRALVDLAESEDRAMTAEENEKFERIEGDIVDMRSRIDRMEATELREAEFAGEVRGDAGAGRGSDEGRGRVAFGRDEPDTDARRAYDAAFRSFLRYGANRLTPDERRALQPGYQTIDGSDVDDEASRRALAVGTDSAGGYAVAEGFANRLEVTRLAWSGMRKSRATIMTTGNGAEFPIPTMNDTGNEGELLGENSAAAAADPTFGEIRMLSYMYSSKVVLVSRQMLQDSAFDVEGFLADALGVRLGRKTNDDFTNGDNSSKPQGVINAASALTAASATAITHDELLELKHAVDPAYRENAQWMFLDSTLLLLKKLKDSQGRPLWQAGIAVGEPDTIDGDSYIVNQKMPAATTGLKSVVYGDFSKYIIRDVGAPILLRLEERYAEKLQVGFLAFQRHDGRILDAGTDPLKTLTMG